MMIDRPWPKVTPPKVNASQSEAARLEAERSREAQKKLNTATIKIVKGENGYTVIHSGKSYVYNDLGAQPTGQPLNVCDQIATLFSQQD